MASQPPAGWNLTNEGDGPRCCTAMHDSVSIECPHCGESFPFALDVSEGSAEFIIDCEVCCRPMTVSVQINDGEIEGLEVVEA